MFLKYIYFFKTYFLFKQNNSSVLIVLLSVKLTFSIFIYLKYLLKKTTQTSSIISIQTSSQIKYCLFVKSYNNYDKGIEREREVF